MSSDAAITVDKLSKCYEVYREPRDRLKQFIVPKIYGFFRRNPKQYYKDFWAVSEISFQIERGETVGIIGKNGSGKSTLLQLICGVLNPTSGSVHTNGRIAALLELGSGFNAEFTGRENVYLNASVLGLTRDEIHERFAKIEAFAEIGDFIDQPVKTYSSGMFVRLAFAVVAHVDADILIIDEALAVGDAFFTQKCMRFLRQFKEQGTLIFVSHDAGSVTGLCDKAVWLEAGKVKQIGSAKTVSQNYLASLYPDKVMKAAKPDASDKSTAAERTLQRGVSIDKRLKQINQSNLRNDLEIYGFEPGVSADFGLRSAEITHVEFVDGDEKNLSYVIGGEQVTLKVHARAVTSLTRPIFGFSVKDRLGQVLFGDNTYLNYAETEMDISEGQTFTAEFTFALPILPRGDYSVSAALATGTQENHVQQHWIHDAIMLKSIASSVSTGLVGIPMSDITIAANAVRSTE